MRRLSPEQRTEVEDCIEAFEQAWQRAKRPSLAERLPDDPVLRDVVLVELVHIDLERRIKDGEPARVGAYLQEFPELAKDANVVLDLVLAEFKGRKEHGESPGLQDYTERFPELRNQLAHRLSSPLDPETHATLSSDVQSVAEPRSTSSQIPARFRGNDRFELGPLLGAGGMGEVYEAYDRQRQQRVALKVLPRIDSTTLSQFKQEFRSLVGLTHPNLVTLYELFAEETGWFYTMERVDGVDFVSFLRSGNQTLWSESSLARLRAALVQLVQGIAALHAAGKVHRDIKPSNVLVTPQGRVVILDPGVVFEVEPQTLHPTEESLAGTVGYMAPEQAEQKSTFASDWYGVGVMLYQTLTGRLPFQGTVLQILRDKQQIEPLPPREVAAGVPEDLSQLCRELLRRRPEDRSGAEAILACLQGAQNILPSAARPSETRGSPVLFVGRDRQLGALRQAFEETQAGHPVSVFVHGESGVGKSALVERFLMELRGRPETVVLQGRCYERESVPYKALDSVVDALSRYLRRLSEVELARILPRNLSAVCQLFPVLGRVELIGKEQERVPRNPDQQELRRQGIEGLRELLGSLGDRKRLVIFIDDLQWGDRDSALLIRRLLAPPDSPVLLLIGSYRTADRSRSDCLQSLLDSAESDSTFENRHELTVERLTEEEIRDLVTAIYQGDQQAAEQSVGIVVRDSQGSPYFAAELTRFAREQATEFLSSTDSLDNLLWRRVESLPREARLLMETVAVAGVPLSAADAWTAAGLSAEHQPALDRLLIQRLVRTSSTVATQTVEPYHDRVRETVVSHLDADRHRQLNAFLATTLEDSRRADPEIIGNHFREAGNPLSAAKHYANAAARARAALAFERAVALYQQSLSCLPDGDDVVQILRIGLADALANAGRGSDAAKQYLTAANAAQGEQATELRRRAAEQYLISGHISEGTKLIETALRNARIWVPRSTLLCYLVLPFLMTYLRLRRPWQSQQRSSRADATVNGATTNAIETAWSAAKGFSMVNYPRGFVSALQAARLSPKNTDSALKAAFLAFHAAMLSIAGTHAPRYLAELQEAARLLASTSDDSYADAWLALSQGMIDYLRGNWRGSIASADQALANFAHTTRECAWEKVTAHVYALWSMTFCGQTIELRSRRRQLLQASVDHDNRYAQALLQTYIMSLDRLCADEVEEARVEVADASRLWSYPGFHIQHHNILLAKTLIDLYCGDSVAAFDRLRQAARSYYTSGLVAVQQTRVHFRAYRATAALGAACANPSNGLYLRRAHRDAWLLARERVHWASSLADLLWTAANAVVARKVDVQEAQRVIRGLDEADLGYHAASALVSFGKVAPQPQGEGLLAEGYRRMQQMGIQNPDRFARMYCPIVDVRG
ncbi:MAG TPA: AAA family ATPase [Planctomycetaceae bacterium]|jgi:Cdc6-like AAA superfamily ATPase|nr:AAA family ATPase [Planctomycetaceae bacterium]